MNYLVTDATALTVEVIGDDVQAIGSPQGNVPNPSDFSNLTSAQQNASVRFLFGDVSTFTIEYKVLSRRVADGRNALFGDVKFTDPTTTVEPPRPSLAIEKSASPKTYTAAGQTITYVLTNDGNVPLYAPFSVIDDQLGTLSCPATPTELAPTESITCQTTYTTTQADFDAGAIVNDANGTAQDAASGGNPVNSPVDTVTVDAVPIWTVSGSVLNDADGSGDLSGGDTVIEGVTVTLYADLDNNGVLDPGEPVVGTAVTDANGDYSIADIPDGNYVATQTLPDGYASVTDSDGIDNGTNTIAITVAGADVPDNDFLDLGQGSIGDRVWLDEDRDGQQDTGEPGIANLTVTLTGTDASGNPVSLTTVTDGDGLYQFSNLPPSDATGYTVTVAPGADLYPTYNEDTNTTAPDNSTNVVLAPGDAHVTANFGYAQIVDLSVTKEANPSTVLPGGTITYTITVTNNSETLATGVQVTDELDARLTDISASVTTGAGSCNVNGQVVSCDITDPIAANGGSAVVTIAVTAN